MTIKLYDLAGEDAALRFSPFCWRTKMALKHKGLAFETVPWRFLDKEVIAPSGQDKVPVIVDDGQEPTCWVSDSWQIATYLDATYPDRPLLFASASVRAHVRFIDLWADRSLFPSLSPLGIMALTEVIAGSDRAYFRETREARFGCTLEEFAARGSRERLKTVLAPLRQMLRDQPFIGGDAPDYGDYSVFGPFQWARCAAPDDLLEPGDAVYDWRARMLDLFDGYAGAAPCRCAA